MKNPENNLVRVIIYLLVVLIPISGTYEFLVSVGIQPSFNITFLKVPREGLMILLLLVSMVNLLKREFSDELTIFLIVFFILNVICFLSATTTDIGVFGVRWALPFFILPLIYLEVDERMMVKIGKMLFVVLLLNVCCQVYQMFFMPAYRGVNMFGLSGRLSGFFALPSIAGSFAAFILFLIIYFPPYINKKILLFYKILAYLSVFLSMSSTGVGLLFVVVFIPILFKSKHSFFILLILIPFSAIVINNLDSLTGRFEGDSETSISTRVVIFLKKIADTKIVSDGEFGNATNGAVGNSRRGEIGSDAFIADSLYTSVLVNYGLLPFIIFLLILFFSGYYIFYRSNDIRLKIFFIMVLLSSVSLITTEIYPVNLLIIIGGAYFLKATLSSSDLVKSQKFVLDRNFNP